ncbi:MAG: ABC transporter permease [Acidobacteriota bacterium]
MRETVIIARHHLRRLVRNPGLVLLLMAIPVTLAVIEYGAFGQIAAQGKLPPVKVLFLDEDDTLLSGAVPQVFSGGPAKDLFELAQANSRDEAREQFTRGQAAALIVVPEGFQDALLAGDRAELVLYKNPIQTIGPEIARSMVEMTTVIGNGLYGHAVEPIRKIRALMDANREPTSEEVAAISTGFFEAGRRIGSLQGLENLSVPVQRPTRAEAQTGFGADPRVFFAYMFPGLVIFGLLFIAQALALRLLRDRMRGLQRRLVMTPAPAGAVIGGSVIFMLVALLCLLLLLAAVGAVVFRIQLRDPLALLAIAFGFTIFAAGLHLLSIALAKSDRSASFVGGVVVLVLSLVGGTFVPAETFPPFLQQVAMLVPNGAAQQGFIDVLVNQRPLAELGVRLLPTWAWGVAALGLAVFVERRRMRS